MLTHAEIVGKCLDINDYPVSYYEKLINSVKILQSYFNFDSIKIFEFNDDIEEIYSINKNFIINLHSLKKIFFTGEAFLDDTLLFIPVKDNYFIYGALVIKLNKKLDEVDYKFLNIFGRFLSLFFKEFYRDKEIREKLLKKSDEKSDNFLDNKLKFLYNKEDKDFIHKLFSVQERVKIVKIFFCYLKYIFGMKKGIFFTYNNKYFIPQYGVTDKDLNFVSLNDALKNFDRISFNKIDFNKKIKKIGKIKIDNYNMPICDLKLGYILKDYGFKNISIFPIKLKNNNMGLLVSDGIYRFRDLFKIYIICDVIAGVLNFSKKINNLKLIYKKIEIEEKSSFFELLGEISHEIKNPIMAISGFANRILNNFNRISTEKIIQYLKIISKESKRLESLLRDLLIFSKTDKFSFENVNLINLIKETLSLKEEEINNKKIKIIFEFNENLTIFGNKSLLKQVILNILTNSIEAINENGRILIKTELKDRICKIIFEDNGGGIPEEIINKIFEPFFSTKDFGTGLGLTVSYRIIQQHGGDIKIKNIENGTRVEVILPCRR